MGYFRVSNSASQDLDDVWEYIAAANIDAADRLIERFYETFQQLSEFPNLGHKRRDIGERPLLFCAVGSYEVVYRVFPGFVEIDAVLHGSRDVPEVLREREPEQ